MCLSWRVRPAAARVCSAGGCVKRGWKNTPRIQELQFLSSSLFGATATSFCTILLRFWTNISLAISFCLLKRRFSSATSRSFSTLTDSTRWLHPKRSSASSASLSGATASSSSRVAPHSSQTIIKCGLCACYRFLSTATIGYAHRPFALFACLIRKLAGLRIFLFRSHPRANGSLFKDVAVELSFPASIFGILCRPDAPKRLDPCTLVLAPASEVPVPLTLGGVTSPSEVLAIFLDEWLEREDNSMRPAVLTFCIKLATQMFLRGGDSLLLDEVADATPNQDAILRCSPLRVSGGRVSFLHKPVRDFLIASAVASQIVDVMQQGKWETFLLQPTDSLLLCQKLLTSDRQILLRTAELVDKRVRHYVPVWRFPSRLGVSSSVDQEAPFRVQPFGCALFDSSRPPVTSRSV